jgi:F-type H+-transporting ATPase subunit delta
MSQIQIAERYAKSLIDLSQEQDMKSILEVCKHPEFSDMLKSPVIYSKKKMSIFHQVFEGKIQSLTLHFIDLLMQKGRESVLPVISKAFIEQYKDIKKIKSARLITATEMSQQDIDQIKSRFSFWLQPGEVMELQYKVDPSLKGGFILEMGDKNYDASVKRRLDELKVDLYDKSYVSLVEKR